MAYRFKMREFFKLALQESQCGDAPPQAKIGGLSVAVSAGLKRGQFLITI